MRPYHPFPGKKRIGRSAEAFVAKRAAELKLYLATALLTVELADFWCAALRAAVDGGDSDDEDDER